MKFFVFHKILVCPEICYFKIVETVLRRQHPVSRNFVHDIAAQQMPCEIPKVPIRFRSVKPDHER